MQQLSTWLKSSTRELTINSYAIIRMLFVGLILHYLQNTAIESKHTHKAISILSLKLTQVPRTENTLVPVRYNEQTTHVFRYTNTFTVVLPIHSCKKGYLKILSNIALFVFCFYFI